jgi:lipid A ethanolaminephosphotransferase
VARVKVGLTSSKDTAGSATSRAIALLFPMSLSSPHSGHGVLSGLPLTQGDARGPLALLLGLSLWLAVPGNLPLWQRVAALTATADHRLGLMLTLGLVLVAGTLALLALCHWPRVFRPLATVLVLATALNSHFMWQYGVVIDRTMMANVAQTNVNEARDLLSWPLLWTVLSIAGPALWWIWRTPPAPAGLWQRARRNLGLLGGSLVVVVVSVMAGYQGLAALMREHKDLRYMISPMNTVVASASLVSAQGRQVAHRLEPVGEDARLGASYASQSRPPLLLVVVGETARAQNWALNGYARPTTPSLQAWQARDALVNFANVTSCGTSTQVSVPCMFSPLTRKEGGGETARSENLLDVLQRAGLAVLWIDNQAGCKGVCDRVPQVRIADAPIPGLCEGGECLDEAMMHGLDARIAALDPQRSARGVVLVMHQMGSHGPAYHKRSPANRKPFQPECRSVTLADCSQDELVNAYDNSIAYTDRFLNHALSWLRAQSTKGRFDTGLFYVSDHGESLGENGLYLHGVPYALAPEQQTHVPMVAWLSEGLQQRSSVRTDCLRERAERPVSHDHLFHSVLGLMDVSTAVRQPGLDLFEPCTHPAAAAPDSVVVSGPRAG